MKLSIFSLVVTIIVFGILIATLVFIEENKTWCLIFTVTFLLLLFAFRHSPKKLWQMKTMLQSSASRDAIKLKLTILKVWRCSNLPWVHSEFVAPEVLWDNGEFSMKEILEDMQPIMERLPIAFLSV